ncbi:MAG: hypothetical protein ABF789_06660 [Liquorilactobacillus satsumensis]
MPAISYVTQILIREEELKLVITSAGQVFSNFGELKRLGVN